MLANVIAVTVLVLFTMLAIRALVKNYRKAKKTGNPSCIGCCACCHKEGGCSHCALQEKDLTVKTVVLK